MNMAGAIIRKYRKRHGLTIKQLATLVGLSEQAISQYENFKRKPNSIILDKICSVLSIPEEVLPINKPAMRRYRQQVVEYDISDVKSNTSNFEDICVHFDDLHRMNVLTTCKVFNTFNYSISLRDNLVVIMDDVSKEIYTSMSKEEFIFMSSMMFSQIEGFIKGLKCIKKNTDDYNEEE